MNFPDSHRSDIGLICSHQSCIQRHTWQNHWKSRKISSTMLLWRLAMTRVYSKNAPLVSSSFLFPSHKQLFSRVTLGSDRTCQRIHQFLVQNPVIQFFIITGKGAGSTNPEWTNGASLLSFRCLEDFLIIVRRDVWNYRNWNWNLFNSELKDALSNIIHSYTLKTLSLRHH